MTPAWSSTLFGLLSALTWGAGDFSGGIAARRTNTYGVVIFAHAASLILLGLTAAWLRPPVPPLNDWIWGGAAGLGGGLGLLLLYASLARGRMSVAAPISALVAAGIPVVFTAFSAGFPGSLVAAGFLLAFAAIWLISGSGGDFSLQDLRLPASAGLAFGFFFLFLHQASGSSVIYPLIAVRSVSISSLVVFALIGRQDIRPNRDSLVPILMSGLLDTLGNGAFALAARQGRVDIAAVLSSLYPASTVLLAVLLLKERLSPVQILGILAALAAIVLIAS